MENVVSARRLRKSTLKELNISPNFSALEDIGINIDREKIKRLKNQNIDNIDSYSEEEVLHKNNFKNFKVKVAVKVFISVLIVFVLLTCKLGFADKIKQNKYAAVVIAEYKSDYSKNQIIEKSEDILSNAYSALKYVVPESLATSIKTNYVASVKPKLLDFELKNAVLSTFKKNEDKNLETQTENQPLATPPNTISPEKDENTVQNNQEGMGGGAPIEPETQAVSSAVSIMQLDIQNILNKYIEIKQPVKGTITSRYGAREQIFDQVNPYHTGLDIANKLNTPINSATKGTVTKIQKLDKYYGNNVEVTTDGVVFKYAHLESVNVAEGDFVDHGSIIGYMGSTGMSTGSHLHFEIKTDTRSVDPEQILKIT